MLEDQVAVTIDLHAPAVRHHSGCVELLDDCGAGEARTDRQFVTALGRGLDILQCFTPTTSELGTSQLARMTGLPQPTVWRLCHTMTELGFLVQAPDQDRLRLGLPVLTLGYAVLASQRIGETAKPYMEAIAKRHQGAVSLGVRDGLSMVYLQRCQGSSIILADLSVGSRVPLAYSATGWAYLVAISERDRKLLIGEIRAKDRQKWTATEPSRICDHRNAEAPQCEIRISH